MFMKKVLIIGDCHSENIANENLNKDLDFDLNIYHRPGLRIVGFSNKLNEVKNKLLRERKIYLSDLIYLFNINRDDKNIFFYNYCMYNFFINVLFFSFIFIFY